MNESIHDFQPLNQTAFIEGDVVNVINEPDVHYAIPIRWNAQTD